MRVYVVVNNNTARFIHIYINMLYMHKYMHLFTCLCQTQSWGCMCAKEHDVPQPRRSAEIRIPRSLRSGACWQQQIQDRPGHTYSNVKAHRNLLYICLQTVLRRVPAPGRKFTPHVRAHAGSLKDANKQHSDLSDVFSVAAWPALVCSLPAVEARSRQDLITFGGRSFCQCARGCEDKTRQMADVAAGFT